MPEINFREFAARIPQGDTRRKLIKSIGQFNHLMGSISGEIRFARKGKDLVEVVQEFTRQRTSPIVDKKSGFVYGVPEGHHIAIRGHLFEYNNPEKAEGWGEHVTSRMYITDSCGYFISSMQPNLAVCGLDYREDKFDKDLFLMLQVFRDPVGK